MFSSYKKNHDPQRAITFGDENQGLVKRLGKIAISPDNYISNVFLVLSGTIIRGTLKAPNSQLVTPISIKLQRPDGCD
jgi:hypothetical protein